MIDIRIVLVTAACAMAAFIIVVVIPRYLHDLDAPEIGTGPDEGNPPVAGHSASGPLG